MGCRLGRLELEDIMGRGRPRARARSVYVFITYTIRARLMLVLCPRSFPWASAWLSVNPKYTF